MLFGTHENLEDRIIRLLLEKAQTVKSLRKSLGSVTIQGIYRILRNLLTEEIVIKQSNEYSLNEDWRRNIASHFSQVPDPVTLSEGDSIRMNFNSLLTLALQWKNIAFPLQDIHAPFPVFDYNPHYIWAYLGERRKESETYYYEWFEKHNVSFFLALGGKTICDIETMNDMGNYSDNIVAGVPLFPNNICKIAIADYVITTRISTKFANEIEQIYKKSTTLKELKQSLFTLAHAKNSMSIIVERSKNKTKKLRKKISKSFNVPKELREKFDLF